MRKLGIITDVNDIITISMWDEELKRVETKQIMNHHNKEYKILSLIEYHKETNTINLLPDNNLIQEEKNFLEKTLKVVMDDIKYQEIFLNELDILSKPKNK